MTTNENERDVSLDDVLHAFSLAKAQPDAALLDNFVRRYPQYAGELTDFAVDLAVDALTGDEEESILEAPAPAVTPAVSKAMSRLQNRLYTIEKDAAARARPKVVNPFASLPRQEFRAFAARIHANAVFVTKLRDRHIVAATISPGFRRVVAEELHVAEELISAHFAAEPEIQRSAHFKSESKPEATKQQSFAEAVASSELTEEQQKYLLDL